MSRDFNGAGYLSVSAAPVTAAPLTIASWVYSNSIPTGEDGAGIVSLSTTSGDFDIFGLALATSTNAVRAFAFDDNYGESATGSPGTGSWFHAAAVFASTSSRTAYLDGSAGTADTTSVTPASIGLTHIGELAGSNGSELYGALDARVAEVAVWNAALTTPEIASLADGFSPLLIRPQSLVFYAPIIGENSPEADVVGGLSLAISGTATADPHPRVFLPSAPRIGQPAPVVGGTAVPVFYHHYRSMKAA